MPIILPPCRWARRMSVSAQPYSDRAASPHAQAVGRDVRQNTPHNGARYGDTAKRRLEIIFFKMQKNCTARRRHGWGIIEPEFQKYVVKTIIAPQHFVRSVKGQRHGAIVLSPFDIITPAGFPVDLANFERRDGPWLAVGPIPDAAYRPSPGRRNAIAFFFGCFHPAMPQRAWRGQIVQFQNTTRGCRTRCHKNIHAQTLARRARRSSKRPD